MSEATKAGWSIFHPDCQRTPWKSESYNDWLTEGVFLAKLSGFAHRYRLKALEAGRQLRGEAVLGCGTWHGQKWVFLEYEGVVQEDWPDSWLAEDEG